MDFKLFFVFRKWLLKTFQVIIVAILVSLFVSFLLLIFDVELYFIDKFLGILLGLFFIVHLFLKDFIYKRIGWVDFGYKKLTIKKEDREIYDIKKIDYIKIEYNDYRHFYAPLFQFRMGFETGKENTLQIKINEKKYTYNFLVVNENEIMELQKILSVWKKENVLIDFYYKNEKKS